MLKTLLFITVELAKYNVEQMLWQAHLLRTWRRDLFCTM